MADSTSALHPCPACGFLVFSRSLGSGETCAVCGWIDDYLQLVHPDFMLGANSGLCLREAQGRALLAWPMTLRAQGAFSRDRRWRPLAAGEASGTGEAGLASPVCYLGAPDPDEFEPYWLDPPPASGD